MGDSLKKKTANGIIWSTIERFSTQGAGFIIGILIARMLSPDDYGLIAMVGIVFAISGVFVDSGFSSALIRKKDRTESDLSTVFYFNILIGLIATGLIFLSAPFIAKFYDNSELTNIIRVLSINVFIGSFGSVQQTLLSIRLDFKTQAKISLVCTIVSGLVALWGAYNNYGAWALVMQMVTSSFIRPIMLWSLVKWKPTKAFSKESFKSLFGFGSKLLVSALLDTAYNNIYSIVIGKVFSPAKLGLYSRASQLAAFPSSNITGIIQRVTFPVLSEIQDDDVRLATNYRKLLRFSAFIVFPMMIGLASVAKPLIEILLGDKWAGSAIYLQIICFAMMWYPIHAINLNLLQVKGRSDLFLRLEIIKKIIGVSILVITIPMGLLYMCIGQIVSSLICLIVNTHYTGKIISVGYFKQMKDLSPILVSSLIMGGVSCLAQKYFSTTTISLTTGISMGIITFISITLLFKFEEITEVKRLIFKRK